MGMVNAAVPHAELESTAWQWAQEILAKSPTAIKMLKFAFNLTDDGMVGQQVFAGEATRLAYMTEEAKEGRNASWKNASRISGRGRDTVASSSTDSTDEHRGNVNTSVFICAICGCIQSALRVT